MRPVRVGEMKGDWLDASARTFGERQSSNRDMRVLQTGGTNFI